MPECRVAEMPADLKQLVLGYLNTCQVMTRLWFWAVALLFFALPLGFYGAGKSSVEASVFGGGMWLITGVISRFLLFEFRQLRAGWVARRIRRRIPVGRERWQAMVRWIAENNDGNYLNTILKKLGVPPRLSAAYVTGHEESLDSPFRGLDQLTDNLLGNFDSRGDDSSARTSVFTTTQTQELRDGEWVTVESSTTSHGNVAPEQAMREAMELLEEQAQIVDRPAVEPIPVAAESPRRSRRSRRKRLDYLPLELDDFEPERDAEPARAGTRESD
jgi:hypothetical protein